MSRSTQHPQGFSVKIQHISVSELSVYSSFIHDSIHLMHHNRHPEIISDSGCTSHMVMMMMSQYYATEGKAFFLHIIYEFSRFIARVYYKAAAFFSYTDYISVAFKAAAYKSFYLHFTSP